MKKLLGILVALVFVSCVQQKSQPAIGLVVSTLNNPFFVDLKNGAEQSAKEMNYEIVTLDSQNDSARELANIEDLISANVQVILMNPVDSESSTRAAQLAINAGIPVISLDRNLIDTPVISHIASDNVAGGQMAGEYIASLVKPTDVIIELEGIPGTSAARDRGQGFNQAIRAAGLTVTAKQPANFDRSQGLTVTENLLQVNPTTKAIFAHNDEMALGSQKAVEASGSTDVIIVGFDATPDAVSAVEAGIISATVAQQPLMIGALGTSNAVKVIKKESVLSNIPVPLQLITNK